MEVKQVEQIAFLRAVVGCLGEQEQNAWWSSSFFGPGSDAFLAPVFPRTQILAQCLGLTKAASLVHDERIGVGNVFHLFRLPEDIEQNIHRVLHQPEVCEQIAAVIASVDAAMSSLKKTSAVATKSGVGPTRVGSIEDLRDPSSWRVVAAHYANGFGKKSEVYPYFTDKA
jgi:hypothetical protein